MLEGPIAGSPSRTFLLFIPLQATGMRVNNGYGCRNGIAFTSDNMEQA